MRTTHDNKYIAQVFETLHALGILEMILKAHCSLVMGGQCLMLNLAKTQRFSEDKNISSCTHTSCLFSLLCLYGYQNVGLFTVRTMTKYSFQGFRLLSAVCNYHVKMFINCLLCLALINTLLISLFLNVLLRLFSLLSTTVAVLQYCGTVTVLNRETDT